MSRGLLTAGVMALPILAGVGFSISSAQSAGGDAASAALSAGFSKLKQERPDTTAQTPLGVNAGFEAVTREREFQTQLSAELARYRAASPALCQAKLRTIQQCISAKAPNCTVPPGLEGFSVSVCRNLPIRPVDPIVLTASTPLDCSAGQCEDTGEFWKNIRRAQADWDAQYAAAHRTCEANRQVLAELEACLAPAQATCNPGGVTQASCLRDRGAAQPTRESFKATLERVSAGGAAKISTPAEQNYPGQDAALISYAQALKAAGIDPAKPPAKLYTYELEKVFGNVQTVDSLEKAQASPATLRAGWEDAAVRAYGYQLTVLSVGQLACDTAYATVDPQHPHRCRQTVRYRVISQSPPDAEGGKTASR